MWCEEGKTERAVSMGAISPSWTLVKEGSVLDFEVDF